jgi:hypothetical protein
MKLRTAAFAAAMAFASTAALAAEPVTAKLASPLAEPAKPVAGAAIFDCQGDTCVAANPVDRTTDPTGCRELARQVGKITAFGDAKRAFSAAKLAQCNEYAKK